MFQIPFKISPSQKKIDLKDQVVCLGSCFSENIGSQLADHKVKTLINPFGTFYNPWSIFKLLRVTVGEGIDPNHVVFHQGVWHHWDAHSQLSSPDRDQFDELIKTASATTKEHLMEARWLILTFGSAYVYTHLDHQAIVANCHKVPGDQFKKSLLETEFIVTEYQKTLTTLRTVNPGLRTILTVSPVRHLRDGLPENNLSKSILLQACHRIVEQDPESYYFPAYELMIDVLRDYRFYAADLVHPNDQAIQYLWERFCDACVHPPTSEFFQEWGKILRSLNHRPFHPNTVEHRDFLKTLHRKLEAFAEKVNVSEELARIQSQLT